jgi:hypothetical protein
MGSPLRYAIACPLADQSTVETACGFANPTFTVVIYTAADPAPRTQTHTGCNTSFTTAQGSLIEDPTTGARATLTGPTTAFQQYHYVTKANTIPSGGLFDFDTWIAGMGLTRNPN